MNRLLPVFLFLLALPCVSFADGLLPPYPYRYLHPPSGLAYKNKPPVKQIRVIPADFLRALTRLSVFTNDRQAGVSGGKGTLALDHSATAAVIRITPVDPPSGLPSNLTLDGNAYQFSITGDPGGHPARLLRPVHITLRWPHEPTGLYVYRSGSWRRLCLASRHQVAPGTTVCPATSLGIFAAVTLPSNVPSSRGSKSGDQVRRDWLIAALVVLVLCCGLGYLLWRRRAQSRR
jgi:hypothetical protein